MKKDSVKYIVPENYIRIMNKRVSSGPTTGNPVVGPLETALLSKKEVTPLILKIKTKNLSDTIFYTVPEEAVMHKNEETDKKSDP